MEMVDNLSRTQLFASNSSRLLPSADLVWQSITPAVQSQRDQLFLCSWRQENRFCAEDDEGAPVVLFAHGLPNLCRSKAASSLGQKAPTFWRINGSKCHVRIITTTSWYFLWRRHNEIIKSFHRTGYAISTDVIKLNGATDSAQGHHTRHVYYGAIQNNGCVGCLLQGTISWILNKYESNVYVPDPREYISIYREV